MAGSEHSVTSTSRTWPHDLGGKVYIHVSEYLNEVYVHIRKYDERSWYPTRRRFSFNLRQFKEFLHLVPCIKQAINDREPATFNLDETSSVKVKPCVGNLRIKFHEIISHNQPQPIKRGITLHTRQWEYLIYLLPTLIDDVEYLSQRLASCALERTVESSTDPVS